MSNVPKYGMDMCTGPLFSKIVRYSLPLYFSGLLQLMFNAADLIVVGRYAEHEAMAAVGSCGSLTFLFINLFIGLSIGTNVLAAHYFGAKDDENLSRTTHTAMVIAILGGFISGGMGFVLARSMLKLMTTPENVIDKATLYMQIYFAGMPFMLLYNFGSSILRALGDTKRPLIYLTIAGVFNVILNLYFVLVLHRDVEGVAWATVISQVVSCILVIRALLRAEDASKLIPSKLRIHWFTFRKMLAIGIPAAAQGSCFSLSNIIVQSSVNSFGSLAMAGNAACLNLEGIVYTGSFAYHQTTISFVSQNLGGKQFERINRSILYSLWLGMGISELIGLLFMLFGKQVLSIYNPDPDVIIWGVRRMKILFTTYLLCGSMDVVSGAMRGLGHSTLSALSNLFGVCALRIIWIFTIFKFYHTIDILMWSYPLSWGITTIVNGIVLMWFCKHLTVENAKL